jgi:hypothetical protein
MVTVLGQFHYKTPFISIKNGGNPIMVSRILCISVWNGRKSSWMKNI